MDLGFLAPAWLVCALVVPLPWLLAGGAREPRRAALRSLALLLVVFALARPIWRTGEAPAHHVLVVDATPSLSAAAHAELARRADAVAAALEADDHYARIVLGDASALDEDGVTRAADSELGLAGDGERSPLGRALEEAARAIPVGERGAVTLLSDGLATEQDWARALASLQERGLPVHALELEGRRGDLAPVALEPLGELRAGHTGLVAVELIGSGQEVTLTLSGPDGPLSELLGLYVEERVRVVMEFEPSEPGFLPLSLRVDVTSGVDLHPGNERLTTTLAVQDPLRTLYLGGRQAGGAERMAELLGPGFEIEAGAAEQAFDAQALDVDLVMVDDRSLDDLPDPLQDALVQAVQRQGLGLFASGGRAAFGPGGWHDTTLASALPIEALQKEEKRDPSCALVVIIDTSGSMGGGRVQLAKEVARLSMRRLLPHDKVGIVEFYGAKRWAAPIQPASNAIELERALNRMDAGGGTVILPAIEEAYYGLKNVRTRFKHVLVLTDGGVERGSFEPLLRRMAAEGMTVSTVLIGPDAHSEFLVNIANWGKGRFYSVPNRFHLPEILLKQPDSALLPSYRPGEHSLRARGGAGWWGDVDPSAVPELAGYVEARARPGAQVLLETTANEHPLLATWARGLGRVTTLLSEPVGAGTQPWSEWEGYGAALARLLARTAATDRAPWAFRSERSGAYLRVIAERRHPKAAAPQGAVLDAAGVRRVASLDFEPRSPDQWIAELVVDPSREARLLAGAADGVGGSTRVVSPASSGRAPERNVDPESALDLALLAAATGGEYRGVDDERGFAPTPGGALARAGVSALEPPLLLLALLCFLFDLYLRRSARRAGATG